MESRLVSRFALSEREREKSLADSENGWMDARARVADAQDCLCECDREKRTVFLHFKLMIRTLKSKPGHRRRSNSEGGDTLTLPLSLEREKKEDGLK